MLLVDFTTEVGVNASTHIQRSLKTGLMKAMIECCMPAYWRSWRTKFSLTICPWSTTRLRS